MDISQASTALVLVVTGGLIGAALAWRRGDARRRGADRAAREFAAERDALAVRLAEVERRHEQADAALRAFVGRTGEHAVVPGAAARDALTGCASRADLEEAVGEAVRAGEPVALLLVDLDHFTDLNATLGHRLGDHVLVAVARRLTWTLRRHDLLVRLGGDQFVVLARPDTPGEAIDPDTLAADVMQVLDIPIDADGITVTARASIGIVVGEHDGSQLETLLRRAELALRRARRRGGTWARFEPCDESEAARRVELSTGLPIALEHHRDEESELDIHFQPIVDLATGRVRSAEALIRSRHPRLGAIPPAELVGMAERDGSGLQLFRFVLGRSLEQLAAWRALDLLDSIAVNMSPFQLVEPGLFDVVADALVEHKVPPSALMLEITEDSLLDQGTDAVPTLQRLHELGVRLAIDDFGTGYSSLTHLRLLHIDVLKLDRSFVAGRDTESRHDALVALALGTAHRLGLTVVAEGVENAATLAMLQREGCDAAQGHHVCRPGTAAAVTSWLEARRAGGGCVIEPSLDPATGVR
ncbi:MAG: putative bifunctional diguanylate cyclase/phosphodiesterase [Ilumatobacteraceae bacterium]